MLNQSLRISGTTCSTASVRTAASLAALTSSKRCSCSLLRHSCVLLCTDYTLCTCVQQKRMSLSNIKNHGGLRLAMTYECLRQLVQGSEHRELFSWSCSLHNSCVKTLQPPAFFECCEACSSTTFRRGNGKAFGLQM